MSAHIGRIWSIYVHRSSGTETNEKLPYPSLGCSCRLSTSWVFGSVKCCLQDLLCTLRCEGGALYRPSRADGRGDIIQTFFARGGSREVCPRGLGTQRQGLLPSLRGPRRSTQQLQVFLSLTFVVVSLISGLGLPHLPIIPPISPDLFLPALRPQPLLLFEFTDFPPKLFILPVLV